MTDLYTVINQKLAIESELSTLEQQLLEAKTKADSIKQSYDLELSELLQTIDHFEQLKTDKAKALVEAEKQLSEQQKTLLSNFKKRLETQHQRGITLNKLLKELNDLYQSIIDEGNALIVEGYRQIYDNNSFPVEFNGFSNVNPKAFLNALPAYRPLKGSNSIQFYSVGELASNYDVEVL